MTITIEATYRNGVLKPRKKLKIPEGTRVQVTITPAPMPAADKIPPRNREGARNRLRKLQRKVGRALREQGITEDEVMREILKDD